MKSKRKGPISACDLWCSRELGRYDGVGEVESVGPGVSVGEAPICSDGVGLSLTKRADLELKIYLLRFRPAGSKN